MLIGVGVGVGVGVGFGVGVGVGVDCGEFDEFCDLYMKIHNNGKQVHTVYVRGKLMTKRD